MIVEDAQAKPILQTLVRTRTIIRARFHRKFAKDIAVLAGFLPRGGTYLDIGAREGRFTGELARANGGDCLVFAFEPVSYFSEILERISGRRSNVTCVPTALSDKAGEFEYFRRVRPNGLLGHAVFPHPERRKQIVEAKTPRFVAERGRCARLDDEIARVGIGRVDFIKIDVEGHELRVIEGGVETIARDLPTLETEISAQTLLHTNDSGRTVLEVLGDLGYRFYNLDRACTLGWCDDAGTILDHLRKSEKHTDVLCWHPKGATGPEVPAFQGSMAGTQFEG